MPSLTPEDVSSIAHKGKQRERLNYYREEFVKHSTAFGRTMRDCRDDPLKPWEAAGHGSFLEFARAEWQVGVSRVYQLCAGEDTRDSLVDSPVAGVAATLSEAHLRELTVVPVPKRAAVLQHVVDSGTAITARTLRAARGRVVDGETGKPEPEPKCCPACGQRIRKV